MRAAKFIGDISTGNGGKSLFLVTPYVAIHYSSALLSGAVAGVKVDHIFFRVLSIFPSLFGQKKATQFLLSHLCDNASF